MKNICTVTYTSIDNKVRNYTFTISKVQPKHIEMVARISEYLETRQWPEEPASEKTTIEWGLSLDPTNGKRCHNGWRECTTETQFFFYRAIAHLRAYSALADECCHYKELGDAVLKAAVVKAQQLDGIAFGRYQEALSRAKNRIRYHKRQRMGDEYFEFLRIIEEFELVEIQKIQLCTEK